MMGVADVEGKRAVNSIWQLSSWRKAIPEEVLKKLAIKSLAYTLFDHAIWGVALWAIASLRSSPIWLELPLWKKALVAAVFWSVADADDSILVALIGAVAAVLIGLLIFLVGLGRRSRNRTRAKADFGIDGAAREEIIALAMVEKRRNNVYIAAPDLKVGTGIKQYPKTSAEKKVIGQALASNFVFSGLSDHDRDTLIDYLEPDTFRAREDIVVQGDPADYFYVIYKGECAVVVGTHHLATLKAGQAFGETGLLFENPRNATVRARGTVHVFKLNRETFRTMLARMHMTESGSIKGALKKSAMLEGVGHDTIEKIAEACVEADYKQGQTIYKKGHKGSFGYFVVAGTVLIKDADGVDDHTLTAGDHFGLEALFNQEAVREYTVVAEDDAVVAALSGTDIAPVIDEVKGLYDRNNNRNNEIRKLKSIPLFSDFNNEMLWSMRCAMKRMKVKSGEYVIRKGETGTSFYLIQQGTCDVLTTADSGKRTVVSSLGPLSYFGEMALLTEEPRRADVVATTDCELLEIGQATFKRIFGFSKAFSRQLRRAMRGRQTELEMRENPPEEIVLDQLNMIARLGTGTFGEVDLVEDRKTGCRYAIKRMSIEFIERHRKENYIVGEKEAMQACDHPFILRLFATFKTKTSIIFLLELCIGGEVFNVIHNSERNFLPESEAKFYSACMILALEHLALKSMAYRDLKPENALVDANGYLKMIDLGFAKKIKDKSYTFCGTPEYMAPEMILGSGHNRAVDYFAFGVFLYEMIAGQTPFYDPSPDRVLKKIVRGRYRFGPKFHDVIKDLIIGLLEPDDSQRLGMRTGGVTDILRHKWYESMDFDELIDLGIEPPWKPDASIDLTTSNPYGIDDHQGFSTFNDDDETFGTWLNNF